MPIDDPLTQLVRHLSQAAGLLAYLSGFCVFMLIHRITKDQGYLLLSMGFLIHFLLMLISYVIMQLFNRAIPPGIIMPIFLYLFPFLQVLGGILLIAGFIKLGMRATKRFRRSAEANPSPSS